ncbi:hypothetical protein TNCV_2340701 [Trichonephila clavipes]|nr:hypothetical protein TNCV_2340701 [Trichonephila clavipes]
MTASHFDAQFLPQREAPELCRCEICPKEFNFVESIQAKWTLKGSFSFRIIIRHGRCRFSASGKSTDMGPQPWVQKASEKTNYANQTTVTISGHMASEASLHAISEK